MFAPLHMPASWWPTLALVACSVVLAARQEPAPGEPAAPAESGQGAEKVRGKRAQKRPGRGKAEEPPTLEERREVYAREEERRVVEIERDVVAALIRFRPWLASERGAYERVRGLGGFTGPRLGEWEAALERASTELVQVQRGALPDARRREVAWLEGWLQSEEMLLATLPLQRRDPSFYVEGIHRSLGSLARSDAPQRFLRMERLSIALTKVPDACEAARNSIRQPNGEWLELGREHVGELIEFLETDLAERARAVAWTPDELEQFERRREKALEAVRGLSSWMDSKVGERSTAITGLRKGLWEKLIELQLGLVVDPAEAKLAARIEIGRLQSALGAAFSSSLRSVPKLRPMSIERTFLDEAERLRGLAATAGWPDAPALDLAVTGRRAELPWEPFELARTGPEQWTLVLGMPSKPWPVAAQLARAELLQPYVQRALAVCFGPVGQAGLLQRNARSTTLTRSWIENRCTVEGFGLYATHFARSLDWVQADDTSYVNALRRLQLLAAARFVLSIDLLVESLPTDEVVRAFVDYTGCDPLTAIREATLTSRDPLRGLGYLVYTELRELERADPERSPADVAAAVARAITDEPCARIGDLLVELRR